MFRVPSPAPSAPPTRPAEASNDQSTRTAGRWGVVLTTLLLGLLLGVLGATPAAAHDTIEGSNPEDGATVATVPTSVTLTFNEEVQNFSPVIQVTGPDGTNWADGDPTVSGVDVSVPVRAGAPAGAYTVAYRIVSSDGHPVTGELTFTAAGAAQTAPSATTPTADATSSAPASSAPASSTAASSPAASSSAPTTSSAATAAASSAAPSSALVSPAANTSDSGSGISGWLIAIIVLVIAAGGAVVAVLVRRARGGSSAA